MTDDTPRQVLHAFYIGKRLSHSGKLSDVFKPVDVKRSNLWFTHKPKRPRYFIGSCYVIEHDGKDETYWLPKDPFSDRTEDHTAPDDDITEWQVADRAAREQAAARRAETKRTTPMDGAIDRIRKARWKLGTPAARRAFDLWLIGELGKIK